MSRYITLFDTHSEYETYKNGQNFITPNVSYCIDNDEIHYNQWHDPVKFVAKFNVTDTTTATSLFNNPNLINTLEIDGVEYTGNEIFQHYNETFDTTGIHTVKYTLNVTSIDSAAFAGKSNLISITIPDSVTSIGVGAFNDCTSLTSVTIPNSVTSIGESAFSGCTRLTSITLSNNLNTIGGSVFGNCVSLKTITLPSSLTNIGGSFGNFAFEDVIFESINPNALFIRDSTNKIITNLANNTIFCGFNNTLLIPNTVTTIGESAFSGCSGLTRVIIPNSVTRIGKNAFWGCTGLTSVTIGSGVTSIGETAFVFCTRLTSVTIPNSVTSIGGGAFRGCSGLTSITIGNGITSIDGGAFYNCTGLTSITSLATTAPTITSTTFQNVKTGGTLYVPTGSNYSTWMGTGNYYLGKYSWTKVEQ